MTIHASSYDTTFGSSIPTSKLEKAILESFIKDSTNLNTIGYISSEKFQPVFITGEYSSEAVIPSFIHPFMIEDRKGDNYVVSDLRPYIAVGESEGKYPFRIRNKTEFGFVTTRTILQIDWMRGEDSHLKGFMPLAGIVFATWLSQVISNKYGLDGRDKLVLFIVSHYYYQSLFYPGDVIPEDVLQKLAVHTIKASKAPAEFVFEVFEKIGNLKGIDSYCQAVRSVLENVAIQKFNTGILTTITGFSWYAPGARELLAVALEHPPTWIAIVYMALKERTYKNSLIARITESYGKSGVGQSFSDAVDEIVSNYRGNAGIEDHDLKFNEFI